MYLDQNEVTPGVRSSKGEIFSDITTNFVALCAIYFPSVTGNEDFREGRREGEGVDFSLLLSAQRFSNFLILGILCKKYEIRRSLVGSVPQVIDTQSEICKI